jgi:hypothetical protein
MNMITNHFSITNQYRIEIKWHQIINITTLEITNSNKMKFHLHFQINKKIDIQKE